MKTRIPISAARADDACRRLRVAGPVVRAIAWMAVAALIACASRAEMRGSGPAHAGRSGETALTPDQIRMVQHRLGADGIPVEATGAWDAQTIAGVVTYQKRHGLKPSGHLDDETSRLLTLTPPTHPDPQRGPAASLPPIPGPSGTAAVAPTLDEDRTDLPGAYQACVDRELARRGLNGWGDPPGTPMPETPGNRYDYVVGRYPDIRTTCGRARW